VQIEAVGKPIQAPPRPFLKWPGGKRQLLPELLQAVASAGKFKRYFEPFLGGGALFFELARAGRLQRGAFLSDINPGLMDAYRGVRDDVETVVRLLHEHKHAHSEAHFYRVRAQVPATLAERAARIIYLNRTCFNGLYRENSKGQFNTPFGRYRTPLICDEENLRAVAAALRSVDIGASGFVEAVAPARAGDLVYFDPPYAPLSKTSDFTAYSKGGFGAADHELLAAVFADLAQRGVKLMLSNSLTPGTNTLYEGFNLYRVQARRSINSKSDRRGEIAEVLVTNFPLADSAAGAPASSRAELISGASRSFEKTLARQWLRGNGYADVAALIDEVTAEWHATGRGTRRNWWAVLAGGRGGKPCAVAGRVFPVLRAAQIRQGLPVTDNALCRDPLEKPPLCRVPGRRTAG